MKINTRNGISTAGALLGALALTLACGSTEAPGTSGAGGTEPSAGSGTTVGGASGSGTGGAAAGAAGASGAGAVGTGGASGATPGGASGVGPGGSSPGGATSGGSAGEPSGGTSGAAGSSGASGAGGMTGTATFTVESQLASEVSSSAPTTVGIVTWSVDVMGLSSAYVEFGLTTGYGMRAPVDLAEADYRTLLLGMKPASLYHFRIVATAGTTTYMSDDYTIETGAPPTAVSITSFEEASASARERGFIVTSYWRGNGSNVPFILDADGDIVWWHTSGPNGIARAVMSADGKNLWMIPASNSGGPLRRVSMDGLDAQTYMNTNGSHDITPVSGELMAFLEYGESDCDSIYEIDPSGMTREVFESQGVVQSSGCHANALRYSQAEDVYTFSDVRQDILVISRTGQVQWRLSDRTMGGNGAWGGTQHGHHLLDDGIVVFANVGGGQSSSDAVEFDLEGQEIWRYEGGGFSQNLGDVQRLPGGNTLVTYSNDGLIQEVDPQGQVVLEIDGGGSSFGYALWRESLYGPPPDIGM